LGKHTLEKQGLMKSFLHLKVEALRNVDKADLEDLSQHLTQQVIASGAEFDVCFLVLSSPFAANRSVHVVACHAKWNVPQVGGLLRTSLFPSSLPVHELNECTMGKSVSWTKDASPQCSYFGRCHQCCILWSQAMLALKR
jgi:hypothetical protein